MRPGRINARFLALLALGGVLLLATWLANQRDALWVTAGVLAMPVLALGWTRLPLGKIDLTRSIAPPRIIAEQAATVSLELSKPRWGLPKLLRLQDQLPDQLGVQPRFALSVSARAGWRNELSYAISVPRRGRFNTGPLQALIGDPLGLSTRRVWVGQPAQIVAYPKTYQLPKLTASGVGQLADSEAPSAGVLGQDDVLLRDYRIGDDVRRVHWRSTAKTGQLMVRREEQANRPTVRILFDNRSARHDDVAEAEPTVSDSLEQVISVAASIALAARDAGYRVRVADAEAQLYDSDRKLSYPEYVDDVLEAFVDVELSSSDLLMGLSAATEQPNILVAATVQDEDIQALDNVRTPGVAILVDAASTTSGVANQLRSRGWRVLQIRSAEDLATAWKAGSAQQIGSLV